MNLQQKEELRRLVLRFMAERSALSFHAVSVQSRIAHDFAATVEQTAEALSFLKSSGLLDIVENKMGGTIYYKVNAPGILSYESGF